jgi:hypothetical protein
MYFVKVNLNLAIFTPFIANASMLVRIVNSGNEVGCKNAPNHCCGEHYAHIAGVIDTS